VLDVLELDAARAPDEDCVRVRRIDDVGDVESAAPRLVDVLTGRLDTEPEMVQKGPLGLPGIPLLENEVGVARLEPTVLGGEAELGELGECALRVAQAKRDMVEIGHRLFRLDPEQGHVPRPDNVLVGTGCLRRHANSDLREDSSLAGTLGREQRELPAASVSADEGELVGPLDHVHAELRDEELREGVTVLDPQGDVVESFDLHTFISTPHPGFERAPSGENSVVGSNGNRVLLLAARQPALVSELEAAGFEVDARTKPLNAGERVSTDLAIVFRGRLIGRSQAHSLAKRGVPVIEVHSAEPQTPSTSTWIRVSNRIAKSDLVQVARALADSAGDGGRAESSGSTT
jgi:hypothetical protein